MSQKKATLSQSITPSYPAFNNLSNQALSYPLIRSLAFTLIPLILISLIIMHNIRKDISYSPFLYTYTIFALIFRISRLGASTFYEYSDENIRKVKLYQNYQPSVSFVIPCKNEEKAISNTVTKCFLADYPKNKLEVIVVNDGSTDNTIKILRSLKRKYRKLKVIDWKINQGKRHAMAEGFRRAKGEIVIQLDSDSYIDPQAVNTLIEYFNNPQVGAVCAHAYVENASDNLLTKIQAAHYFIAFRILKAAESVFSTVFCCSGCSSAYRKEIILPIIDKWLSEKFLGKPITWGDDRALTNWVLKQGYKTVYTDKAKAFTIVPNTWRQFIKQQIRWKKGWFVNSIKALSFIFKKDAFVALTYFIPLIITTLLSPFVAIRIFFWDMLLHNNYPLYYLLGIFLINLAIVLYYMLLAPNNKYWPYVFVWSIVHALFLTYLLFYALLTIQNRKWGTR